MFTHPQYRLSAIRVADSGAYRWLWSQGPCFWRRKVEVTFREVDFWSLQPAPSLKHWDVLAVWTRQIACRRKIPPLIVSETEHGTYFIHDGNHRLEAIRVCYRNNLKKLKLRVAVVKPKPGFRFVKKYFGDSWTYALVPIATELQPEPEVRIGRTVREIRAESTSAFV